MIRFLLIAFHFLLTATVGWSSMVAAATTEATAHDPHYGDSSLWPADVEKTGYFKQSWPKAPLLVWARTEKAAEDMEPRDPANWLVDGKPATQMPSERVDVYFPEGSIVQLREKTPIKVRHLTVGAGVRIPKSLAIRPAGNVWIKELGTVAEVGAFSGENDVFLRNDNTDFTTLEAALANKILFNKAKDASVEILGMVKVWDEVSVMSGTLIVGPGATLVPGNRSVQYVYPDGKLILMSGAKFHKRGNQTWASDLVVAGELLAGTPDRPLTEDCTIGLSWKRKGRGSENPYHAGKPDDYSLVVRPDGIVRVHSADPSKARLVITWNGLKSDGSAKPELLDGTEPLAGLPRMVDMVLQGDVALEGVLFDRILRGGIKCPDPSIRDRWTMTFGDHNEGKPEELFTVLQEAVEPELHFDAADPPKPYSQQTEADRNTSQDYYR